MTKTQTDQQRGDEIYDSIMLRLEPELMTKNIGTLDAKYAGELEEKRAIRMERYEKAFQECDRIIGMMERGQAAKVRAAKADAQSDLHGREKKEQSSDVETVEGQLDSLNP